VKADEARLTLLGQKLDRAFERFNELGEQLEAALPAARDEIEKGSLWTVGDRALDDFVAFIPKLRRLLDEMLTVSDRIISRPSLASSPAAFGLAGREFYDNLEKLGVLERFDPGIRQHTANRWMYERGAQANQKIERRDLIEACMEATKVRWREAEKALCKYPKRLKFKRGRPKNK
jgi:hypothetical protein